MSARTDIPPGAEAGGAIAGRLLHLASDQLAAALDEASSALGRATREVLMLAGSRGTSAADAGPGLDSLLVDLQVVDRLQQRLGHLELNLRRLGSLLAAHDLQPPAPAWADFLCEVRKAYTTEAERAAFDRVIRPSLAVTDQPGGSAGA